MWHRENPPLNKSVLIGVIFFTGDSNSDTKWYFVVIALICGIFIGMILLYAILSLRQRFKSKNDNCKLSNNYNTHPEGATDNSAYQGQIYIIIDLFIYKRFRKDKTLFWSRGILTVFISWEQPLINFLVIQLCAIHLLDDFMFIK